VNQQLLDTCVYKAWLWGQVLYWELTSVIFEFDHETVRAGSKPCVSRSNRVSWDVCNNLGVVESKPVSDVWKLIRSFMIKGKLCAIFVRKNLCTWLTNLWNHLSSMLYSPNVETAMTKCRKSSTLDGFVRLTRCSETRAKNISDMIVQDLRPIQTVDFVT